MKPLPTKATSVEPVAQTGVTPPNPRMRYLAIKSWQTRIRPVCIKHKCKSYLRQQENFSAEQVKVAVVNVLTNGEGTCRQCGQGDIDVLCLDHITNNGSAFRNFINRTNRFCGQKLYKWLIRTGYETANQFQVLCSNCNLKKEILRQRQNRVLSTCPIHQ